MPNYADWFVGAVSIAVGVMAVWNAYAPNARLYELPKIRFLERLVGRGGVRYFLMALGLAMIALGVAIALGYSVQWDER